MQTLIKYKDKFPKIKDSVFIAEGVIIVGICLGMHILFSECD